MSRAWPEDLSPGSRTEVVGVLLTQRAMTSPHPPRVFQDFWTSAYAAIDD
ncbi:MAG: serine hydrolase [Actinoallomurus sp.]|jgi:hypothetical protein|nr:serine hydrolase [Actinoallomurus sp.]